MAGVIGLGVGLYLGVQHKMTDRSTLTSVVASASWASSAQTVDEQARESDLIVRVKVDSIDKIRVITPQFAKRLPDKVYAEVPFSDYALQILETYKGSTIPGETIKIMQTGGLIPAKGQRPAAFFRLEGLEEFRPNGEHILFLKDISGDATHAPDRELYRLVNPASRYDIHSRTVTSYVDNPNIEANIPKTLEGLLEQIRASSNQYLRQKLAK